MKIYIFFIYNGVHLKPKEYIIIKGQFNIGCQLRDLGTYKELLNGAELRGKLRTQESWQWEWAEQEEAGSCLHHGGQLQTSAGHVHVKSECALVRVAADLVWKELDRKRLEEPVLHEADTSKHSQGAPKCFPNKQEEMGIWTQRAKIFIFVLKALKSPWKILSSGMPCSDGF